MISFLSTLVFTEESNKLLDEYRHRLKKAENEIQNLQTVISRLEIQAEKLNKRLMDSEKRETELKAEKRKILREVCKSNTVMYHKLNLSILMYFSLIVQIVS